MKMTMKYIHANSLFWGGAVSDRDIISESTQIWNGRTLIMVF